MNPERYQIISPLGSNEDGVCYLVRDKSDQQALELWQLVSLASVPLKLKAFSKSLRLLSSLQHPAFSFPKEVALDQSPPYIAMAWPEPRRLFECVSGRLPMNVLEALTITRQMVSLLVDVHRLGLCCGRLTPYTIRGISGSLRVDLFGLTLFHVSDAETRFLPPERDPKKLPEPPGDLFSIGALLFWLLTSSSPPKVSRDQDATIVWPESLKVGAEVERLVVELLQSEPSARPSAREVLVRLDGLLAYYSSHQTAQDIESNPTNVSITLPPKEVVIGGTLGRYRLIERLGEGAVGIVYRAQDTSDDSQVALKVLKAHTAKDERALRRFKKEARLLSNIKNPYVTNLISVQEDEGIHFLVLELVEGKDLRHWLGKPLPEKVAYEIISDVARALADMHERGIVHRDVKPENILIVDEEGLYRPGGDPQRPRVKLSDFGLARHIDQSESLAMTRQGSPIGTPLYMAPEQCSSSGAIGPSTDIYSLGITLFELLAGQLPFQATTLVQLISMHCFEAPPSLKQVNPSLSEEICEIVHKCLSKKQSLRYSDAAALLDDLEKLYREAPRDFASHPILPPHEPDELMPFHFYWDLTSSPAELWPYLSNTHRTAAEIGYTDPRVDVLHDEKKGAEFTIYTSSSGTPLIWREHQYEWIAERRLTVFRDFEKGPWEWCTYTIELSPREKGGTLVHTTLCVKPKGLSTKADTNAAAAAMRAGLEKVYRRIDLLLAEKRSGQTILADFFRPPSIQETQRRRLEQGIQRLRSRGVPSIVARRLEEFLAESSEIEVSRIRPMSLARLLNLDPEALTEACLIGAKEGLLLLLWDILCPSCRVPSEVKDTLRALKEHGRCDSCNLEYELDFDQSIEMVFRCHPEIRGCDTNIYCATSPSHSPHVLAQVRLQPGERFSFPMSLPEDFYLLRGPENFPFQRELWIEHQATSDRISLSLSQQKLPAERLSLKPGSQRFTLENATDRYLIVRIERGIPRHDVLTAARASSMALFREFFPQEVLSSGQLAGLSTVALLVTQLQNANRLYRELGDHKTFLLVREYFAQVEEQVRRGRGAVIKTVGESVWAVFPHVGLAVEAGLHLQKLKKELKIAIHCGPAMVTTLNNALEYFGATVNLAAEIPSLVQGPGVFLTQEVATDPKVTSLIQGRPGTFMQAGGATLFHLYPS